MSANLRFLSSGWLPFTSDKIYIWRQAFMMGIHKQVQWPANSKHVENPFVINLKFCKLIFILWRRLQVLALLYLMTHVTKWISDMIVINLWSWGFKPFRNGKPQCHYIFCCKVMLKHLWCDLRKPITWHKIDTLSYW